MRLLPLVSLVLLGVATAEAGSSAKSLGKQFQKLDADGDETLSRSEFAKLIPAKISKKNALDLAQSTMFAWFDEDASEGVEMGEWLEGKLGDGAERPDFSDEACDELDANGDEVLQWNEFSRIIGCYVPSKTAKSWFEEAGREYSFSGASLSLGGSGSTAATVPVVSAWLSISISWPSPSIVEAQDWLVGAQQLEEERRNSLRRELEFQLSDRVTLTPSAEGAEVSGFTPDLQLAEGGSVVWGLSTGGFENTFSRSGTVVPVVLESGTLDLASPPVAE